MTPREDDVVLKLLHTADWHLGRRFPRFGTEAGRTLSRARRDVLERLFREAEHHAVHAVLCAGDLFDTPNPEPDFREALLELFSRLAWVDRRVVLLPGNHDPLLATSVWRDPAFRAALPPFVTVVDEPLLELPLTKEAVLYAVPCQSLSSRTDPTERIPPRAPGDTRIRVGLVHGSTFDSAVALTNFPIARDAALEKGLDYLALGDTHGFRLVPSERTRPPTVYPGAPEPTAFDEVGAGQAALVLVTRAREAIVQPRRVAQWTWEEVTVRTLEALRLLVRRTDLASRVLRLTVQLQLPAREYQEAEALLTQLAGTESTHAKVGVLELVRSGLSLDLRDIEQAAASLPPVLRATVAKLRVQAQAPETREVAERALFHLFALVKP